MKAKILFTLIVISLIFVQKSNAQNAEKVLKAVMKLIVGAGAAESFKRADVANSVYKDKDAIFQSLKSQGLDPINGAIYSIYFDMNNDASSLYWADLFSRPDIFAKVQIEGQGSYLVPNIYQNYSGQPILEIILTKKIKPGSRIIVHICDDDSLSNTIWNQILQSRIDYKVTSTISCYSMVRIDSQGSGSIRLLDHHAVIDAPDFIASAEFSAPDSQGERWVADGKLIDSSNRNVGSLQFAQFWMADPQLAQEIAKAHSEWIFWVVFGGVLLCVFISIFFYKN